MREIRVGCYAGYRADERPLHFELCGRRFEVAEVEDRWYSPGVTYFRVRATDGNFYVLRHDEGMDAWTRGRWTPSGPFAIPVCPRLQPGTSLRRVLPARARP